MNGLSQLDDDDIKKEDMAPKSNEVCASPRLPNPNEKLMLQREYHADAEQSVECATSTYHTADCTLFRVKV